MGLAELYCDVDNLRGFGSCAEYMSDKTLLKIAARLSEGIINTGRREIFVAETGASPLAYVCRRYLEKSGYAANWHFVKFPRNDRIELGLVVNSQLTEPELISEVSNISFVQNDTRKNQISALCPPVRYTAQDQIPLEELLGHLGETTLTPNSAISDVLEGTKLSAALGKPFLFFDEYISSGRTLQYANEFFSCAVKYPDFMTISYHIDATVSKSFPGVAFSYFDKSSRGEYLRAGAYPFENRVDLIGYFYNTQKTAVAELYSNHSKGGICNPPHIDSNVDNLIGKLVGQIRDSNLAEGVKPHFMEEQVRVSITEDHLARYSIYLLEKHLGEDSPESEFLWLAADMYGPMWSPLPKAYHLDFMNGLNSASETIWDEGHISELLPEYMRIRSLIISGVAGIFETRRKDWLVRMEKLLEGGENGKDN